MLYQLIILLHMYRNLVQCNDKARE
jgi:hypothetical protein